MSSDDVCIDNMQPVRPFNQPVAPSVFSGSGPSQSVGDQATIGERFSDWRIERGVSGPANRHNCIITTPYGPSFPRAGAVSLCLNFRPRMLNGPAAATSSIGVIAGTFPSGNG